MWCTSTFHLQVATKPGEESRTYSLEADSNEAAFSWVTGINNAILAMKEKSKPRRERLAADVASPTKDRGSSVLSRSETLVRVCLCISCQSAACHGAVPLLFSC